jgi:iron donor protein CyaY
MDDLTFHKRADESLEDLFQALNRASEHHELEADMNAGALSVEFEEPKAKFVVSPNSPVRQIWVSANVKSYKLEWVEAARAFVLPATGQTLKQMMAEAIGRHLGEEVEL